MQCLKRFMQIDNDIFTKINFNYFLQIVFGERVFDKMHSSSVYSANYSSTGLCIMIILCLD